MVSYHYSPLFLIVLYMNFNFFIIKTFKIVLHPSENSSILKRNRKEFSFIIIYLFIFYLFYLFIYFFYFCYFLLFLFFSVFFVFFFLFVFFFSDGFSCAGKQTGSHRHHSKTSNHLISKSNVQSNLC